MFWGVVICDLTFIAVAYITNENNADNCNEAGLGPPQTPGESFVQQIRHQPTSSQICEFI